MKRLGCCEIASGNWIALNRISYQDNMGVTHTWESVSRKKSSGAVAIICTLVPSGRLVLIRQYRPPVDSIVVEFPAGLVNPGESPEETAVRELREETGYRGKLVRLISDSYSSPGLCFETVRLAIMTADEREQGALVTDFDETEDIETVLVEPEHMVDFLQDAARNGDCIDGRVCAYAMGLSAARRG